MKFLILNLIVLGSSAFAASIAESGAYTVDKAHSSIHFNVSHLGVSLTVGRFNSFSGSFDFQPNGASSAQVEIDAASIDTNQRSRDNHLRADDFLNTTQFPKIRFKSTSVEYDDAGNPVKIVGDMTLLNVTKSETFDVKTLGAGIGPRGKSRAGFTATTSIQRSNYGMSSLLGIVGDQIDITIQIEGIKK